MTHPTLHRLAIAAAAVAALQAGTALAESSLSFNVGAVTDYRYRGISQTNLDPAVQAGVDYAVGNGLYVGAWASGIEWLADTDYELDLYAGYKGALTPDLSYDVGVLRYLYDGSASYNTTEVYGALSYSLFTVKYSQSTTNLFGVANSKQSGYLDLSATFDLGNGLSLVPHVGRQVVKNNGAASYTDYAITLAKDFGQGLSGSLTALGTNAVKDSYRATDGTGRFTGSDRLVAAVKYSF